MIVWDELAALVERKWYDTEINRDEEYFICPHCGEPIYECDFPEIEDYMCPVCCEPF